jgi:hypothetical protein
MSTVFSLTHALDAFGEGLRGNGGVKLDARHDFISRLLGEVCVVS